MLNKTRNILVKIYNLQIKTMSILTNMCFFFTGWKHGRRPSSNGILSLFSEIWYPPDEDAVKRGGRHLPQSALHLSHSQVFNTHLPLQLTDLHETHRDMMEKHRRGEAVWLDLEHKWVSRGKERCAHGVKDLYWQYYPLKPTELYSIHTTISTTSELFWKASTTCLLSFDR